MGSPCSQSSSSFPKGPCRQDIAEAKETSLSGSLGEDLSHGQITGLFFQHNLCSKLLWKMGMGFFTSLLGVNLTKVVVMLPSGVLVGTTFLQSALDAQWNLPQELHFHLILVRFSFVGSVWVWKASPAHEASFGSSPSIEGSGCCFFPRRGVPSWFGAVGTCTVSLFYGAGRCSKFSLVKRPPSLCR